VGGPCGFKVQLRVAGRPGRGGRHEAAEEGVRLIAPLARSPLWDAARAGAGVGLHWLPRVGPRGTAGTTAALAVGIFSCQRQLLYYGKHLARRLKELFLDAR
jgi:hypothetical protein